MIHLQCLSTDTDIYNEQRSLLASGEPNTSLAFETMHEKLQLAVACMIVAAVWIETGKGEGRHG